MASDSDRKVIEAAMPELPEGYYFKLGRKSRGYQYTKLMRKRLFWFDKKVQDTIHRPYEIDTPERLAYAFKLMMEIHGGNGALLADQEPKSKLTGKYSKHPATVQPKHGDGIEYDEGTQTFTLSEEILERLKNGI